MKRLSVHAAFGLAATIAASVATVQALRLQQARQLNEAIVAAAQAPAAPAPPASASLAASAAASGPDVSPAEAAGARDAPREVRLARATALSRAGDFHAAFTVYSGLIEPGRSDALSRQAQFNLGNMYLRQGLGAASRADTGPLIELAKQRYRDLLRADPQDWDARYNLERALRAAPEDQEPVAEQRNEPVERRNVSLRGMNPGDLP